MTTRRQMVVISGVFGTLMAASLAVLPMPFGAIACVALAGPVAAGLLGMLRARGTVSPEGRT